jgi:predicted nucleic acid-binding protein
MGRLRAAVSTEHHQFISDDISLLDDTVVDSRQLSGHRQLTDVYLLALAVTHDARLVTLDTRIPLNAVRRASERHLAVI